MSTIKRFHNLSLQRRLALIVFSTLVTALLLASVTFVTISGHTFRQQITHELATLSLVMSENSTAMLIFDRPDEAELATCLFSLFQNSGNPICSDARNACISLKTIVSTVHGEHFRVYDNSIRRNRPKQSSPWIDDV